MSFASIVNSRNPVTHFKRTHKVADREASMKYIMRIGDLTCPINGKVDWNKETASERARKARKASRVMIFAANYKEHAEYL